MKLIEKYIEWLVVIAVVMITTIAFSKTLMATLNLGIVNGILKYFSLLVLYLIFLYQKRYFGIKLFDRFFVTFYLIYCFYILVDITIFRRYPLENMLSVPESFLGFILQFVKSWGYLLCAQTIVTHFNIRKYILLSVIVCTIPSILFIQAVGVDVIQAGILEDDENYISALSTTYSNMPLLVFGVVYYKTLFNRKLLSMAVCSCIIVSVLYILFAYGKRGPMLWSFVGVVSCLIIKAVSIKKYVVLFGLTIVTFIVFMDPILDVLKETLPKTGKKLEVSLKEGNTSGRFDTDDPKHSTYLIGIENFSRSPIWGYYFRLVTNYKHYQGVYAHNVFIEILMTMGFLGFIPFMILLLKAYNKSRMTFKQSYTPNQMACFILFICVFLQLQTSGSCVFRDSFWLFLYMLCCLNILDGKIEEDKII